MKPNDRNQKILWIALALFCLAAVLLLLTEVMQRRMEDGGKEMPVTHTTRPVKLEEPDYDADIFEDADWLDEDRLIHYSNGNEGTVLTPECNEYGEVGALFLRYFDALMQGDAQTYASLFTASYRQNNTLPDYFTMQRIYNIRVTEAGSYTFSEGQYAGYTRMLYRVEYAILKNDGTFRDDLPSGYSCAMTFELLSYRDTVLINGIEPVRQAVM